jgi:hypothetical protein
MTASVILPNLLYLCIVPIQIDFSIINVVPMSHVLRGNFFYVYVSYQYKKIINYLAIGCVFQMGASTVQLVFCQYWKSHLNRPIGVKFLFGPTKS